jgi:uncharacterized SAM-binding protein YcdF (DUF218 family)
MRRLVFNLVLMGGVMYTSWQWSAAAWEVRRMALLDEQRNVDVILVPGAAQYNGRPSPAFRARLDHAHTLWSKQRAKWVLTTGGSGGDTRFTEAEVGRDYLRSRGIPPEFVLVEDRGTGTGKSMLAAAEIMKRSNMKSCLVASDGYHLLRSVRMLRDQGMQAWGSPRPDWMLADDPRLWLRYFREAAGIFVWDFGLQW